MPDDHADVMMTALTMLGNTLTPAFSAAIMKGEDAALPVEARSFGSLEGTMSPTMKSESR